MRQFDVLQLESSVWLQKNYHDNESQHFVLKMEPFHPGWKVGDTMPSTLVCMGSLMPLMGVTKELGELADTKTDNDRRSALGAMFINLCDFATREGMDLPIGRHLNFQLEVAQLDPLMGMLCYTGKLYEGVQNRHLDRGGMEDDLEYMAHRSYCTAMVLLYMDLYATDCLEERLLVIANRAWNSFVTGQNWHTTDGKGTH